MDTVEKETLVPNPYALEANPILNAGKALYDRLREAADLVVLEGKNALDRAVSLVVTQYEALRAELGNDAKELVEIFQRQLTRLITGTMEYISAGLPAQLGVVDPPRKLDSIAFKLTLSPSVSVSATEWLRFVATGGVEVQVTYRQDAAGTA